MASAFLSYAPADMELAGAVAAALTDSGVSVRSWNDLPEPADSRDSVEKIAATVECIIVLWSSAASASPSIAREVTLAIKAWALDRLVLAQIDAAERPGGLRDIPAIDLSAERESRIGEIARRVARLVQTSPPPFAAAAPAPTTRSAVVVSARVLPKDFDPLVPAAPAPASTTAPAPRRGAARRSRLPQSAIAGLVIAALAGFAAFELLRTDAARAPSPQEITRAMPPPVKETSPLAAPHRGAPAAPAYSPPVSAAPRPATPYVAAGPAPKAAGRSCPGWPFPTLSCTQQFPALPRMAAPHVPPQPGVAAQPAAAAPTASTSAGATPLVAILAAASAIVLLIAIALRGRRQRPTPSRASSQGDMLPSTSASSTPRQPEAGLPPVTAPPEHHEIFVSYSRRDEQLVDRIVGEIEEAGLRVWMDRQAGGHGGQRYAAPIVAAIKSSRLIALMCSHNSFASDHVVREIYVAGDFRKPFIAFQLDQAEFPDELLYFLSGYPRIPADSVEPALILSELARLLA